MAVVEFFNRDLKKPEQLRERLERADTLLRGRLSDRPGHEENLEFLEQAIGRIHDGIAAKLGLPDLVGQPIELFSEAGQGAWKRGEPEIAARLSRGVALLLERGISQPEILLDTVEKLVGKIERAAGILPFGVSEAGAQITPLRSIKFDYVVEINDCAAPGDQLRIQAVNGYSGVRKKGGEYIFIPVAYKNGDVQIAFHIAGLENKLREIDGARIGKRTLRGTRALAGSPSTLVLANNADRKEGEPAPRFVLGFLPGGIQIITTFGRELSLVKDQLVGGRVYPINPEVVNIPKGTVFRSSNLALVHAALNAGIPDVLIGPPIPASEIPDIRSGTLVGKDAFQINGRTCSNIFVLWHQSEYQENFGHLTVGDPIVIRCGKKQIKGIWGPLEYNGNADFHVYPATTQAAGHTILAIYDKDFKRGGADRVLGKPDFGERIRFSFKRE